MKRYSRDEIKQRAANARRSANESTEDNLTGIDNDLDTRESSSVIAVNGNSDEWNPPSVPGHHEGPGGGENTTPDSITAPGQPSYREVSWSNMFSHFLDSRHKASRDAIDKCSITYLGESFPLSIVLDDLQEGGKLRLHHPGPPLDEAASTPAGFPSKEHPSHLLPEDMNCLLAKKAFDRPDRATYEALMSCFLETYYPLYPIVNRQEFLEQYQQNRLPWLLLQASCFAAATFCPESVLHRAGYAGRRQARFSFYRKAKALFDTGYESNKIVILQSMIMLSHWGGSPNTYWNFYTWVSTAVTLAETMGMHRSLRGSDMQRKDAALLKRIWWVLVLRDAFCASLVGRPFRINMDMGDAEMLEMDDFEEDVAAGLPFQPSLYDKYALYQIELAKLSILLRQIVYTRWLPKRVEDASSILSETISSWRQCVHPALEWEGIGSSPNLLATILSIVYDHHIILANLGRSRDVSHATEPAVAQAAQRISASASSIVMRSQQLQVPHELFHCIFTAGMASYEQIRSPQFTEAQLGRATLINSQMTLQSVYNSWDASGWVMDILEKLSNSLPRATDAVDSQRNHDTSNDTAGLDFVDFDTSFAMDLGSWQSNPMLSALFDFPTEFGDINHPVQAQPEMSAVG